MAMTRVAYLRVLLPSWLIAQQSGTEASRFIAELLCGGAFPTVGGFLPGGEPRFSTEREGILTSHLEMWCTPPSEMEPVDGRPATADNEERG